MAKAAWKARLRERVMGANIPMREADAELRAVNALFTSPVSLEAKRPGTAMNALAGAIERTQAALGDFASALPLLAPPP